jgi:iron complex outermembrane receptor protein
MRRFTDGAGWVRAGIRRDLYSVTLQDQWTIGDDLELTGGARLDRYSDVGDSLTPRLAGVWRLADRHILKAQYAEAFRPPTLSELNQNSNGPHKLKPETLASTELSYIYRGAGTRAQVTLFHTRLDNLITNQPGSPQPYVNLGEIRLRGVETEWEKALRRRWNLKANLSYTDAHDQATGRRVPGSSKWLANATLDGSLAERLRIGLRWRYVGKRARWPADDRPDLGAYQILDVTLSWREPRARGLTLRAGVDNLFNKDGRDLAASGTYVQDLPQPGRTWWAQLSYALQ